MKQDQLPPAGHRLPAPLAPKRQLQRAAREARPLQTLLQVRPERAPQDREFLPAALEILETPPSPIRLAFLYAICGLLAAAIAWSWFGRLDVFAEAAGKIQATGRTKVIQPLVAGNILQIGVKNGDVVREGDVLIALDPSEAIADRNIAADRLVNATAEIARRRAAIAALAKEKIQASPVISWDPAVPQKVREREENALRTDLSSLAATLSNLKAQRTEKETDRDKYTASVAAQNALIAVIKEQVAMGKTLADKGWNSRATLLAVLLTQRQAELALATLEGSLSNAVAAIPVIDSQIATIRESFVAANTKSLVDQQRQQEDLAQQLAKAETNVRHMTLTAPIAGTIQASAVTTVGQVVTTGQQLMQLVPSGGPLEIEAYVLNTDIGFVRAGQDAVIKVNTFPFTRYGTLSGTVTKVATDALPGAQAQQLQKNASQPGSSTGSLSVTSAAQQTQDLVFPVTVVTSRSAMMIDGREIPLSPGMTVTVEIKTESRRAIDYILSPLAATLASAGHER